MNINSKKSLIIIIITALLSGISYFTFNPTETSKEPAKEVIEAPIPYERNDYGRWLDEDKDCQNTRHEIFISSSKITPTFKTDKNCLVTGGQWTGAYTNQTFDQTSQLDIDHIVPLKEAHISGASKWDKKKKSQFFNDTNNLIAVSRSANRSKGSKDPASWLPENESFHCTYIQTWIAVKEKYSLEIDPKEQIAINNVLDGC